jgi:hypothetical protein
MPFKSEEQRRYLWANEPEIARDWTETYGSRIEKNIGGIMRVPFRVGNVAGREYDKAAPRSPVERPSQREERIMAGLPPPMAQKDIAAGVGRGGRGSLADPMEKQDYMGPTRFGPARKYTGSFLDNVFNQGYRPVTPTGQFQSRLSQYGGNILSGIMGAINPFLGILSRGFQNFRDTPYLQDYISNLRPRQMSDVFVDQGRGSGIRNIPMEENIIPLSEPTSLYNLDDMLMSKPVSSKSPMADPMWGGIMNVDTGLINDYDPEDRSTWFDTHPATGEAVLKPETGYDYTDLNKRGYSAHEFDQRPWDKTQIGVRPYRYNYSEMVQKPPLWWKWLPKM